MLITIALTVALIAFEKWMSGDLDFFSFRLFGSGKGRSSAGNPHDGVLKKSESDVLF
jgi:hypothetical protein